MFWVAAIVILLPAIISRFIPNAVTDFISFGLGLIGQLAALWSATAWLGSAQITYKLARGGAETCTKGDFNCFSQIENLWAAEAALATAICLLAIWNVDNARKLFSVYSSKK